MVQFQYAGHEGDPATGGLEPGRATANEIIACLGMRPMLDQIHHGGCTPSETRRGEVCYSKRMEDPDLEFAAATAL